MDKAFLAEVVAERYRYCAATGRLFHKLNRPVEHFASARGYGNWKTRFAGKEAGSVDGNGYILVRLHLEGKAWGLKAHHVAWALHTGSWPTCQLDHRNGRKTDNRFTNLREATGSDNTCNQEIYARNTSGHKGITVRHGNFVVRVNKAGVEYRRKLPDLESAIEWACFLREELHGRFANNGQFQVAL